MKVLFVSNTSAEKCGVAEYGRIVCKELRQSGVEVWEWDGHYPTLYERVQTDGRGYLPDIYELREQKVDLIHLNWDPQATNHFLPEHFPKGIPLSVFLHDLPPDSTCPVMARADLLTAFEDRALQLWAPDGNSAYTQKIHKIDHGVPSYTPKLQPIPASPITVGVTGLRSDLGMDLVKEICHKAGWVFSVPRSWYPGNQWASTEEEIDRLAACTFNICWYHTSGRGKSMAAMFCVAARRPLIISGSTMFSVFWDNPDAARFASEGLYAQRKSHNEGGGATQLYHSALPAMMDEVLYDLQRGEEKSPDWLATYHGWPGKLEKLKALWRGLL